MRRQAHILLLLGLTACDQGESDTDSADVNCTEVFFADADGDGYGDPLSTVTDCDAPEGFVAQGDDCDDADSKVHPESVEVCDGRDNDCNTFVDSDDPGIDLATAGVYFLDSDGDGYGSANASTTSCDKPEGYVIDDTDCDDSNAAMNPGETEVCDGYDNDCDSLYDDEDSSLNLATAQEYYLDQDGDGFGAGIALVACTRPSQHVVQDGDCNDEAPTAYPDAAEVCDSLDNDCDGTVDGGDQDTCSAYEGVFAGDYTILAQEKLGNSVINSMRCTGTSAIVVDLAATPTLQAELECTRIGGLILFDSIQTATIEADVDLDGAITGVLVHRYNDSLVRSYNLSGSFDGDSLQIAGTGSLWPHPQSAVAWQVSYSISATRDAF